MSGDASSLYGLLHKAKPLWSGQELRKVHEKLSRVDIRDAESLGRAVCEGRLNAALASAGERRLKSSTVTQLKVLVRDIHKANQAEQECASIMGLRRCYCGVCQYCAQAHEPRPLQHSRTQGALPHALSVWPTVPAKAAPSRSLHARRPPAFGGAGAPSSALRRTGESIAVGAGALGQRSAAERVSMLGKQLRSATEGLEKATKEGQTSSGSRQALTDGLEGTLRQSSRTFSGRTLGRTSVQSNVSSTPSCRPSLQPASGAVPLAAVDESAANAAQSVPRLRGDQMYAKKRVSLSSGAPYDYAREQARQNSCATVEKENFRQRAKRVGGGSVDIEDEDGPARLARAWEDTLPVRIAMPQPGGEPAARQGGAPRRERAGAWSEEGFALTDNVPDDASAWTVEVDADPSRAVSTAGSTLEPWSSSATVRRVLRQGVEAQGADGAAACAGEAAGRGPSPGPRSPSSARPRAAAAAGEADPRPGEAAAAAQPARARQAEPEAGAGQNPRSTKGFQPSLSPVASSAALSPNGEAAELPGDPGQLEAMRNSHSEVSLSSAARTPLRPPRGEEPAPDAGKNQRRTRMIRAYG